MDLHHQETKNHTERVTETTVRFAQLAGITSEKELKHIERGAMLHDVGKIGIPDAIIKPGKLSDEGWDQNKLHFIIAHNLLSKINYL